MVKIESRRINDDSVGILRVRGIRPILLNCRGRVFTSLSDQPLLKREGGRRRKSQMKYKFSRGSVDVSGRAPR